MLLLQKIMRAGFFVGVVIFLYLSLLCRSGIFLSSLSAQEFELKEEEIEEIGKHFKEKLPKVSLTPDIPFYFLKSWGEEIRIALTRSAQKKIELRINYAQERLAEAYKVIEKEKLSVADKLLKKYEEEMEKIKAEVDLAENEDIDIDSILNKVFENLSLKQALLEEAEERSKNLNADSQITAKVMKKRGLEKAKESVRELMTLKVSSEARQERTKKIEKRSLKDKIFDFLKVKKVEFVSPIVNE